MPKVTDLSGWSTRRKMLLALVGGALTGLGQAPFGLVWLALIGLAGGFWLFQNTVTTRQAGWIGWAFGVGYFALVLNWIVEPFLVEPEVYGWMAPFALIGMAAGMALFWALAFWLARWQGSSIALVVFWAGAEVLRSVILTGFPWGLLGYVWLDTGVAQFASLIGPHGLTLLILAGIWMLITALEHRKRMVLVPVVVVVGAGLLYLGNGQAASKLLYLAKNNGKYEKKYVRIIQTNAPQHEKWDREMIPVFFDRNLQFTAAVTGRKPDLIIWPETSVPYLLNSAEGALELIADAADGVPVVLGMQRRGEAGQYYNSLVVLGADGVVADVYDKSHLVPFGEYMPGGWLAAKLGLTGLAAQGGFGFGSGDGLRLVDIPGLGRALPLICYEAIFPEEVGGVTPRPDWLLQITNDAWFGNLTGPQQHLAQARFRAIEQGLPMVRAANTGISAVIDARGQITAKLGLGVAGYLYAPLPHGLPPTLYSRTGDLPVTLLLIVAAAALLLKRRRFIG
ncbi:apolipoprotein N-acyltransferase [Profundibacter sp.]|uniref:apolipoprotein N-acyltransferase n=1 Tax=Profundibacter sp. TaxID=3101071 RepID=UPI003D0F88A5